MGDIFFSLKKASGLFCEMLGASRHDILGLHSQRRRTIDVVTSRAGWGVVGGGVQCRQMMCSCTPHPAYA